MVFRMQRGTTDHARVHRDSPASRTQGEAYRLTAGIPPVSLGSDVGAGSWISYHPEVFGRGRTDADPLHRLVHDRNRTPLFPLWPDVERRRGLSPRVATTGFVGKHSGCNRGIGTTATRVRGKTG